MIYNTFKSWKSNWLVCSIASYSYMVYSEHELLVLEIISPLTMTSIFNLLKQLFGKTY